MHSMVNEKEESVIMKKKIRIYLIIGSVLLIILSLALTVGIHIINNSGDYEFYRCFISDEYNEEHDYNLSKYYYFSYRKNKVYDGRIEVNCKYNSIEDFNSYDCDRLNSYKMDKYYVYDDQLLQKRITYYTFKQGFKPDRKNYLKSYIKYLESNGMYDCKFVE